MNQWHMFLKEGARIILFNLPDFAWVFLCLTEKLLCDIIQVLVIYFANVHWLLCTGNDISIQPCHFLITFNIFKNLGVKNLL